MSQGGKPPPKILWLATWLNDDWGNWGMQCLQTLKLSDEGYYRTIVLRNSSDVKPVELVSLEESRYSGTSVSVMKETSSSTQEFDRHLCQTHPATLFELTSHEELFRVSSMKRQQCLTGEEVIAKERNVRDVLTLTKDRTRCSMKHSTIGDLVCRAVADNAVPLVSVLRSALMMPQHTLPSDSSLCPCNASVALCILESVVEDLRKGFLASNSAREAEQQTWRLVCIETRFFISVQQCSSLLQLCVTQMATFLF